MESARPRRGVSGDAPDLGDHRPVTHDEAPGLPLPVLGRALQGAGVAAVLLDPTAPVPTILWANDSFGRLTGHLPDDVVGLPVTVLESDEGSALDLDAVRAAMGPSSDGTPVTWRMLNRRADGAHLWCEYALSQVRGGDGQVEAWLALLSDVSGQVRDAAGRAGAVRRAETAESVVSMVSGVSRLLNDMEYPFVLRDICAAYGRGVVAWGGFFLDDGGLGYSDGVPPVALSRPRRSPVSTDALGDARVVGESAGTPTDVTTFIDPLRELVDGYVTGPVDFPLATTYPAGSDAATVSAEVRERAGLLDAPGDGPGVPVAQVVVVPGRRAVHGVFVSLRTVDGVDDETSARLVTALVDRVAVGVDTLRLHAREHTLAETLQRSMLPEQVEVAGLDVWTYYAPTSDDAQIGGDWYDILQIDEEIAGVVIGDVVGHDIEAAATMGQLRSVVRSYAFELTVPGPVLERVDQLVAGMRVQRSASLVYATLRRTTGPRPARSDEVSGSAAASGASASDAGRGVRWRLEYSRAGHLPPLLVRRGVVTQLDGAGGALVGFGSRARTTAATTLEPGDTLVLYTDGLIERRDRALRQGLDALVSTAASITATDAAGIGEELLARLAEAPEDDVAVVVVRVPDPARDGLLPTVSPRSRRWVLPSEPASIGRARHAVLRTCQAWEIADVSSAELVVSELVANGVLHGWGHIALRLFDTGDGLRIEVEDSNPSPPVTTDGHANRLGGYGMQIVERLADWGWRPSGTGKLVWAKVRPVTPRPAQPGA
ncbi:PAS domain S-box [Sanguibacter keddieii DSM 10542]|uniref:PAS domain S-box n=1 Tax=Sanguibacter keddieii (strain ATCC 51767 / DSM 10542 / NCFB 3025 / ST-74) TaxID=446469 RepID=D1BEX4_SANKS|nr:PAS domain S-box [Sanguibacter keddieii DSM 10542]